MNSARDARSLFASKGFCVVPFSDLACDADWRALRDLTDPTTCAYEHARRGDVDEPANAAVARFLSDVDVPTPSALAETPRVLDRMSSSELQGRIDAVAGAPGLHLRRCQAHVLDAGGFIGSHVDHDSNRDYIVSLVITLNDEFSGGALRIEGRDGATARVPLRGANVLLMAADLVHEVEAVTSGRRRSLACFYASTLRPNTAAPSAYQ